MSFYRPPLIDHVKIYWDTYNMFGEQMMMYWHQTIAGMPPYRGPPGPPPTYTQQDIQAPSYDTNDDMYDPETNVVVHDELLDFLDKVYKDNCIHK